MQQVNRFNAILLAGILTLLIALPLHAFQSTPVDSAAELLAEDVQIYQIRRLQLRQILRHQKIQDPLSLQQIESLQREAQTLADHQEYAFALLILDEIDDLLRILSAPEIENLDSKPAVPAPRRAWNTDAIFGFDSWQQKFELNYGESDTVLSENSMNPFASVQIKFDYAKPAYSLTANSLLKKSRDYFSLIQDSRFNKSLSPAAAFNLNNYLDWTHFTPADYVSYFQNKFSAGIFLRLCAALRLNITDEFRLRKYEIQQDDYPNYSQNEIKLAFETDISWQQRTGLAIRLQQRRHSDFGKKDFNKFVLNFSGDFSLPLNSTLRIFNDLSQKNYATQNIDTLYQSNYLENWLVTNFSLPVSRLVALELNDNFTFRNYKNEFSYLRDNLENQTEAIFRFQVTPNLNFRAGYYLDFNILHESHDAEDISAQVEDYYSHGPSFSLDYFWRQQFLLNISNTSRNRIYPNAQNIENLTLYSDRNLKSLFIFVSWQINSSWEMNLITNYDADQDRENENSDSRSTLFSLEITRHF